ncbi:D-alanine aminotransferase [Sulfurospirillum diekertiae]|uniref:branched-chain-amino-acid transaminase n=1 Tax=Sulfurospirillum diekertiae TaxID=1854492 RepID=A0A290HD90_9BACT|nr:D-amino acid aminotransferase [Sulfurospirillum diekertiae]ATB69385.1 D-alanine aminotransferase [Sulfurospirillum diekertiae]
MSSIVFLNGDFCKEEDAKVSIFDRGYLFGDGIYEVVPVINGKVIDKAPFFERFEGSMSKIGLKAPFCKTEIITILDTLIAKNDLVEGGIYMQVTRGVAPREFYFPENTPTTFMAFTFKKEVINHPLAEIGVKVVSCADIRWKRRDIKSISLLGQVLAKEEVHQKGAYEGWMVEDGFVTEGTSSAAFIIKNGVIITRPLSHSILPSIRRKVLMEITHTHGIKVEERLFSIEEALNADEAFMASATVFLLPIIEIDGKPIGSGKPGEMVKKLRALYVEAALKEANA